MLKAIKYLVSIFCVFMGTTAVIKNATTAMGEVISVIMSGIANGLWYAIPANIQPTVIKQFKTSGGK